MHPRSRGLLAAVVKYVIDELLRRRGFLSVCPIELSEKGGTREKQKC